MPPEAPQLPDYEERRNAAILEALEKDYIFRVRRLTDAQEFTLLGEISESEEFKSKLAEDKLTPDEINIICQALDRFSTLTVGQIRNKSDEGLLEYKGVDRRTVQIYRFLFGQEEETLTGLAGDQWPR